MVSLWSAVKRLYGPSYVSKSWNEYSPLDYWEQKLVLSAEFLHLTLPPMTTSPPVSRPAWWSAERSLGIKRGFGCNPVNDWILADIPCSILPNKLRDAKCSRWQLQEPRLSILLQMTRWGVKRDSLNVHQHLSCMFSLMWWRIYSCYGP